MKFIAATRMVHKCICPSVQDMRTASRLWHSRFLSPPSCKALACSKAFRSHSPNKIGFTRRQDPPVFLEPSHRSSNQLLGKVAFAFATKPPHPCRLRREATAIDAEGLATIGACCGPRFSTLPSNCRSQVCRRVLLFDSRIPSELRFLEDL